MLPVILQRLCFAANLLLLSFFKSSVPTFYHIYSIILSKRQFLFGKKYTELFIYILIIYLGSLFSTSHLGPFQQLTLFQHHWVPSDASSLDDARLAQRVAQDLAPRFRNSKDGSFQTVFQFAGDGQTCGKNMGKTEASKEKMLER